MGLGELRKLAGRHFFLLGMVAAVGAAKFQPGWGRDGSLAGRWLGRYGVALLFLLSGVSLESAQIRGALSNAKLNALVQLASFGLWPAAGWAIRGGLNAMRPVVPWLGAWAPPALGDGILAMSSLPTTVNMCVLLTGAAGGNVAAALCNAVLGNALGVVVTPALLLRWFASAASSSSSVAAAANYVRVPLASVLAKLSVKVVLPVAAGQALRNLPSAKALSEKHSKGLKRTQELILLAIVWNAFCTSFSNRLGLDARQLAFLLLFLPLLHLGSLLLFLAMFSSRRLLRLSRPDAVAAAVCASHKTLAFGLPLLRTVFDGHPQLASLCAPVLLVHPIQLLVGSLLVPRLREYASAEENDSSAPAL
jgi:sodium/bile acid cotransporter 7